MALKHAFLPVFVGLFLAGCGGGGGTTTNPTPTPTPTISSTATPTPTPSPSPTPSIAVTVTSITPNTGGEGDTVTITGTGFNAADHPAVYFHFQPADYDTITVTSPTTLTVVVPAFRTGIDSATQDINISTGHSGPLVYPIGHGPINFTYTRFN